MRIPWNETGAPETVEVTGEAGAITVDDLKGGSLIDRGRREAFAPLPFTHWGLIENFVDHMNGRTPLACDGVEGRKSTVILDIVSTLRDGGAEVVVDYRNAPAYDATQAAKLRLLG
jgi:hypothetical protein